VTLHWPEYGKDTLVAPALLQPARGDTIIDAGPA